MFNQSIFMKVSALLMAVIILFASCSSATLIQSTPSGAKVYMNEEYMGVTPFSYSDTKIVGSTTTLRIEKDGFEPMYTYLTRNEEVDVGAIIGGLFVWVPFLWTMKYKPVHNYELKPMKLNAYNPDSVSKITNYVEPIVSNDNHLVSSGIKD